MRSVTTGINRASLPSGRLAPLLLVSGGFLLGGLAGCLFARAVSGSGAEALTTYLADFFTAIRGDNVSMSGFFSALWTVIRWPLLVLLLGCTAVGIVGIPILFFLRGFLLSFTVCAFVRVLGSTGVLFSFLLFGISSLITVPVLFLLGVETLLSVAQARDQPGKQRGPALLQGLRDPALARGHVFCLLALVLATLWEAYLVPIIVVGSASFFVV